MNIVFRPILHKEHRAELDLKAIAESIILQAIEDLWNNAHRKDSIEFFNGESFHFCAELSGMGVNERLNLIGIINKAIQNTGEM